MVLAVAGEHVYLERRPAAGIWGGLWSFPEMEAESVTDWCSNQSASIVGEEELQTLRHSFSHYDLDILPVVIRFERAPDAVRESDSTWHKLTDPPPGGIAAPVQKLMDSLRDSDHVAND